MPVIKARSGLDPCGRACATLRRRPQSESGRRTARHPSGGFINSPTRQRCQVALSTLATAALKPSWASEMTSFTPPEASSRELAQERCPERLGLGRPDIEPEHLAPPLALTRPKARSCSRCSDVIGITTKNPSTCLVWIAWRTSAKCRALNLSFDFDLPANSGWPSF